MENKVIAKEYVEKNYINIRELIKVIEKHQESDNVSENGYIALDWVIDYLKEKLEGK